MLDLVQAAHSHKKNVTVSSYGGIFDYIQYGTFKERQIIKSLGAINRNFLTLDSPEFKIHKVPINFMARLFTHHENEYPDIIIDDVALSKLVIKKFQNNGAITWLNHAGSPQAFWSYFMNTARNETDTIKAQEKYLDLIGRYDGVLFQSEQHRADAAKLLSSENSVRLEVLYPSCDEDSCSQAKLKPTVLPSGRNIIIVGSVQPRKGQHRLSNIIDYFAAKGNSEKVNFHIIGNIIDKEYFAAKIKPLVKKRQIYFHGFRPDYLLFMAHADILVQLSDKEGFSRVLREAMYLGLPIVTFKIEGYENFFSHYDHALLSNIGDVRSISETLFRLISNEDLLKKYKKQVRKNYDLLCSKELYLNRFSEIFIR